MEKPDQIVHICAHADWVAAQIAGEYRALSLEEEGFIHFSRPGQALATANRYYPGSPDLMLLWVDARRLASPLRWENSHGESFPHLYGPLNLDAVQAVTPFPPDPDGTFRTLPSP